MTTGHLAVLAISAISGILIPRVLGIQAYGRYSSVLAVTAILQAVSTLGFPQVGVRFLAPLWRTDHSQALALGSTMWTIRLGLTPLLGAVGFFWLGATVASEQGLVILLALGLLCALRCAQQATRILFLPIGHVGKLTGFEFFHTLLRLPVVLGSFLAWGLSGTFAALPVLQAVIWGWTTLALRRVFPLSPRLFRWSALRPYLSFAAWSFVDAGSTMLHVQFSIYAVAVWSTARDAGLLAIAMQLYLLVRSLHTAVHRSLQPLLAEIEAAGEEARLRHWSELTMGCGVVATVTLTVFWAALGRPFLKLVFGSEFLPAHLVVTLLFGSLILFSAAQTCHALLYVRNQAKAGSLTSMAHSATGMVGLFLALAHSDSGQTAPRIAWVFLGAAALFFIASYIALGWRAGLWLPLYRSLLLALPAALVIPAAGFEAGWGLRLLALTAFLCLYALAAAGLGFLSRDGLAKIVEVFRRRQGARAEQ